MIDDPCKKEREEFYKATKDWGNAPKNPISGKTVEEIETITPKSMEQVNLEIQNDKKAEELRAKLISAELVLDECEKKHGLK